MIRVLKKILSWFIGLIVLLFGLLLTIKSTLPGIVLTAIGCQFLPPIRRVIGKQIKRKITLKADVLFFLAASVAFFTAISVEESRRTELVRVEKKEKYEAEKAQFLVEKKEIIAEIEKMALAGKSNEIVAKTDGYVKFKDDKIDQMRNKAMKEIKRMEDELKETNLLKRLKEKNCTTEEKEKIFYELTEMKPGQIEYKEQYERYKEKRREEQEFGNVESLVQQKLAEISERAKNGDVEGVVRIAEEMRAAIAEYTPRNSVEKQRKRKWEKLCGRVVESTLEAVEAAGGRMLVKGIPFFLSAEKAIGEMLEFDTDAGTLKTILRDPLHLQLTVAVVSGEKQEMVEENTKRAVIDGIFRVLIHTDKESVKITAVPKLFIPGKGYSDSNRWSRHRKTVSVRREVAEDIAKIMLGVGSLRELVKEDGIADSHEFENGRYEDRMPGLSLFYSAIKAGKPLKDERKARYNRLIEICGEKPIAKSWDGEICGLARAIGEYAHDPDSIDVEKCSAPKLTEECWRTRCKVRGKNAFGANVVSWETYYMKQIEKCLIIIVGND